MSALPDNLIQATMKCHDDAPYMTLHFAVKGGETQSPTITYPHLLERACKSMGEAVKNGDGTVDLYPWGWVYEPSQPDA